MLLDNIPELELLSYEQMSDVKVLDYYIMTDCIALKKNNQPEPFAIINRKKETEYLFNAYWHEIVSFFARVRDCKQKEQEQKIEKFRIKLASIKKDALRQSNNKKNNIIFRLNRKICY